VDAPLWVSKDAIDRLRGERARPALLDGLYAAGVLDGLAAPTVAIVGTRAPSPFGRAVAFGIARSLGEHGICVLSGLALGIDGAAHAGALAAGAPTIGILGGGHARFFPREHRPLAGEMLAAGGAIVSPFAPEEPARPAQFLQRNGVLALLADAVVVVEAAARSGALNTASWAAGYGVPVGAVPGDVDRPKSAGCLALIRDGATLVRNAGDVLEMLGRARPAAVPRARTIERSAKTPLERRVLRIAREGARSFDDLHARTGASPAELTAALLQLELAGTLEREGGSIRARWEGGTSGEPRR
jgi:DNA processing protein